MNVRRSIVVRFQFDAVHHWPGAPQGENPEWYLKHPHRHVFHVEAVKDVTHGDRDIEFIAYKRRLLEHCRAWYQIGVIAYSCEQIAQQLLEQFKLRRCSVFEYGENGAEVEAI